MGTKWTRDEFPFNLAVRAGLFGLITTPIDGVIQFEQDLVTAILGGIIVGGVLFFLFYFAGWVYAQFFMKNEATDDSTG